EMPAGAISEADADGLRTGLRWFFRRIVPPEQATARDYIRWFEALIGPDAARLDELAEEDQRPEPTAHFPHGGSNSRRHRTRHRGARSGGDGLPEARVSRCAVRLRAY